MAQRQEATFSLRYEVEREIAAPPSKVWARLTDARSIVEWNSTIDSLEGEIAVGSRLRLQVPIAPGRTFSPKVVELEPETRMVWQDGFFPFFQGTRTFTLSAHGGTTRFTMSEHFRGMMLPMIKGSLPDFRPAFDQFADDLRDSCERG